MQGICIVKKYISYGMYFMIILAKMSKRENTIFQLSHPFIDPNDLERTQIYCNVVTRALITLFVVLLHGSTEGW